jgi:hypothetical protein
VYTPGCPATGVAAQGVVPHVMYGDMLNVKPVKPVNGLLLKSLAVIVPV